MELKPKQVGRSETSVSPMQTLKTLSYNPGLMAVARKLHLTKTLRKCYQWVTGGRHNILKVGLGSFDVFFHVHNPLEYRTIEQCYIGYERDFIDVLLSSLVAGGVVLDVGANIGQFTLPLAMQVGSLGQVIAVEPEVNARAQLEANLSLNRLSNVRVLGMAFGEKQGEGRLAWTEGTCPAVAQTISEAPQPSISATSGVEIVTVEMGDEVLDRECLPVPAAAKIDVEGYEFHVIRGLRRTLSNLSCRLLCCEIHPAFLPSGINPQTVIDEVKGLGFNNVVLHERSGQIHMVARKDQALK